MPKKKPTSKKKSKALPAPVHITKEQLRKSCKCHSVSSKLSLMGAFAASRHFYEQNPAPLPANARAEIEKLVNGNSFSPMPGFTVNVGIPAALAEALLSPHPIDSIMALPDERWQHRSDARGASVTTSLGFNFEVLTDVEYWHNMNTEE